MFDQLKDMYKMQREAKKLQEEMRKIRITGESRDGKLKVYYNGAQELEDMNIDDSLMDPSMKDLFVKNMKEAQKDFQKKLQKQAMKDIDMDQIRNILGR
ncbi:MAG: YbaB/EbfC family nucleoid-associated protein [bacterium]